MAKKRKGYRCDHVEDFLHRQGNDALLSLVPVHREGLSRGGLAVRKDGPVEALGGGTYNPLRRLHIHFGAGGPHVEDAVCAATRKEEEEEEEEEEES